MNLFIESEGDIEFGINCCKKLAKMEGTKNITLGFSSKLIYDVFIRNLSSGFLQDPSVPFNVNLDTTIILPPGENNNE